MLSRKHLIFCLTLMVLFISGDWKAMASEEWDKLVHVSAAERDLRHSIIDQSEALLLASRYDELDRIADQYRKSKETFTNGEWKLSALYEGTSAFKEDTAPENKWKMKLDRLNDWVQKKPQSITARVALAECLTGYAAEKRGTNFASKVTEEQWRGFNENMKKAAEVLIGARTLKEKCPGWWSAFQSVAMAGMDRETYEKLFNEAISFEPKYSRFYFLKTMYLFPIWYGEEGEWEQFAKSAADGVGGKDGDILYARIVWAADSVYGDRNLKYRNPSISWDRVQRGVDAMIKGRSH
jgi:uncharacterized protein DUF4034